MSSREAILGEIREAISDIGKTGPRASLPPCPELWPLAGLSYEDKIAKFNDSIKAVMGECIRCPNLVDAVIAVREILAETNTKLIGNSGHPLAAKICANLEGDEIKIVGPDTGEEEKTAVALEKLDGSIVGAEFLLADTGSCIIAAPGNFERLLCYLPPLCIVIAEKSLLCEHLPDAWRSFLPKIGQSGPEGPKSGEFLIVSGPSRTADIEKILILGVHGPKRLVVLILEN